MKYRVRAPISEVEAEEVKFELLGLLLQHGLQVVDLQATSCRAFHVNEPTDQNIR